MPRLSAVQPGGPAPHFVRLGLATLFAAALGCATASAQAQPIAATTTGVMNPTFAATPLPPGMIAMQDPAPAAYTPDAAIHGDVSTGIATGGGRGVAGNVIIPIVPGTATLSVGGSTGQMAVLLPQGGKHQGTASLSTYGAALHVQPTNDVQVDIAVSGATLRLPTRTGAEFPPP